jgi:hypothetical protein
LTPNEPVEQQQKKPRAMPGALIRLDDRFHETCVMERMVWWRIPCLRLAKRGAGSWQDGGE